ncbi:relaxase/mobilization nuclease domain-containing protein [Brucella sp. 22210]|uniref:relaxase/mobilization nuclease domain-containing protein n=2 Tax=Brucella sp. 22210 TaxID=3453892 RepID=UPI003F862759
MKVAGLNHYEYFKTVPGGGSRTQAVRIDRYAKNVRHVPQVMFKAVKSGFASGFIGLSAQLNYVLGKAEHIIDPTGELDFRSHVESATAQKVASRWVDGWKKSKADGKHSMHLVASFPAGTSVGAVSCIVRDTCEELLSQGRNRFEYVAAIHADTNNPHGHIVVDRRNAAGEWFFLAKDHEYNYDVFKDSLVRHAARYGIELNNSSRFSRGAGDFRQDSRHVAMKGLEGVVRAFCEAKYRNQVKGSDSFYIMLDTKFGERTMWGVGLETVLEASGAGAGDTIRILHNGKKPVVVPTKDGGSISTHRNDWRIAFNGREYGTFDETDQSAHIDFAVAMAERRSALKVAEAGFHDRFSQTIRATHLALSVAFFAAANAIRNGDEISNLNAFKENIVSDEMIENDSNDLMQKIENACSQLDAVWSHLPNMAPAECPQIEEKYFEALGDMDHLLVGERRRDFMQNASGSVYGDEYRKKLANGLPPQTAQRVEFYGINKDEFAARAGTGHVPAALETHWIERDASAIAAHMNLDMTTEQGRTEAFNRAASFHAEMMDDLTEKVELTRSDWQELQRMREQFDQAANRGPDTEEIDAWDDIRGVMPQRDEFTAEKAAFIAYAQKSPLHAELASQALDIEGHDKNYPFIEPASYIQPEDRVHLNQIATERGIPLDFDLRSDHAENRVAMLNAVENRYFGIVAQEETAREVRELAAKDSLTFDESRKLIDGLKAIVGETGVRDLQNGNVSEFVEHLKAANIEIDQREAYDMGKTYVEAMRQHGYNMDDTEKAILTDKVLFELHEEREQLEEQRQLTEDTRSHNLNSDHKLGL